MSYYRKERAGLIPSSDTGQKHFDGLKLGEVVKVSKGRHYEWEAKYFDMLDTAFQNQQAYDNEEWFRHSLKLQTGFCEKVVSAKTGESNYKEKSFTDCTREEFEHHYAQCKAVIFREYGIDLTLMNY